MQRILVIAVLVVLSGLGMAHCGAQNLVQNGSFEQYTICPEFTGYVSYASGWQNLHTNSADYFNRCQTNSVAGVPFNTCGYQEPADGDGYVGMITAFPGFSSYREMVGRELVTSLQAGVPVCISFRVAVGGFGSWNGNSANLTAKGVGVRFFNDFPADWPAYLYPNDAALALDVVPTDTAIWYTVSGTYTPDSAFTHIAIANFYADSLSEINILDSTGYGVLSASYVFIDDVRVSEDLTYCGATNIPSHHGTSSFVRVFPQPFSDRFQVELGRPSKGELNWTLWDATGRIVLRGSERSSVEHFEVLTGRVPAAAYAITLMDDAGAFAPLRLLSVTP